MNGRVIGYQVVNCSGRQTAVVRATVLPWEVTTFLHRALGEVLAAMEAQQIVPGGEPFVFYQSVQSGAVHVEAGFPTIGRIEAAGDVVASELPGGRTVTGVHCGPFDTLSQTYADMHAWATSNGMRPTGALWEVYLNDPEREPNPDQWRSGVFMPVEQSYGTFV